MRSICLLYLYESPVSMNCVFLFDYLIFFSSVVLCISCTSELVNFPLFYEKNCKKKIKQRTRLKWVSNYVILYDVTTRPFRQAVEKVWSDCARVCVCVCAKYLPRSRFFSQFTFETRSLFITFFCFEPEGFSKIQQWVVVTTREDMLRFRRAKKIISENRMEKSYDRMRNGTVRK